MKTFLILKKLHTPFVRAYNSFAHGGGGGGGGGGSNRRDEFFAVVFILGLGFSIKNTKK
uniref:Uncharacterized protein n=1 Tax=viral metagenome TaxID=1070528 RepID=A0A6C0JH45_9ZZZZ